MAESVVTYLLEKLGDAVVQEALRLHGVGMQVEKVSRDLSRMQAFLRDADSSRNLDARQKQLVMEVRDLAYSIEDVIDTYLLQQPEKKPGKREAIMRVFMKTKKIPALHKLADEIDAIQARIKEISESRVTYGINNLGGGERKVPVKPLVPLNYDDPDVVGFEDDRQSIVRFLLDQRSSRRRSVVSIVGAGGLGKTTLARKVFNSKDVKSGFDNHIWVTVSQKFELIDILRKIAEQVQIEPPKDLSEHHLTDLYELLTKKKYLLVLDDIWANDLWTCIKGVLTHANNGSKILITTRNLDVAEVAESEPYKLKFLTYESSLKLLLKKALPYHDAGKGYPSDLYNLAEQLSKKCKGLPLALVVLGGLLSKRPASHAAWSKVLQTMDWSTDGGECFAIISTSYDELPFALKSCFMYFAAFPEDYEIKVPSLLRMWIAEGFIPQQEKKTLEDTAESFLEDLVQRSMVQVSQTFVSGYVKTCRVHDLLRDLAVQKVKDDNFLMLCSKGNDLQSRSLTRRLAIHCDYDEPAVQISVSVKPTTLNLRSLLGFIPIPNFSQHRLLKVLRIHTDDSVMVPEVEMSNSLGQLRYCELGNNINFKDKYTFEKFVGGMKFIQTLDLSYAEFCFDLPDCVWYVKTLRHVILSIKSGEYSVGPPPLADLPKLQTLVGVRGRKSWEKGLPNLTNVKEMDIDLHQFQSDTITRFLSTLEHLTFLGITTNDFPKLINMRGFSFHQNLQTLYLGDSGNKSIALDFGIFPDHLSSLFLNLRLGEDPMPVLEKMENLHVLGLYGSCKIKEMSCSAGGFGQLKRLRINGLKEVVEWKIEKGAMPLLEDLIVAKCPQLLVPHGLQYLTVLEEITWRLKIGDPRESQIRSLCKHVPSIKT